MNTKITTLFLPLFFLVFAAAAQFSGYLNPDNAWLVYVADQVAAGKELHQDVVETNPPLVVYLMLIPAYFADFTGMTDYHSFTLFVFAIAGLSIYQTRKITDNPWILLATVFALVFFPAHNFGQREHIFIILILPYLLSHLENKKNYISTIMAAIGFAIKPYYLALLVVTELYFAWQKRDAKSLLNPHNYLIAAFMFAYLGYMYFIEKDYLEKILPLMLSYYSGFNWNFDEVFRNVINNFILFQIPIWVAFFKYKKAVTKEVIFFALCNFICIAIVLYQQKSWSNHFYPVSVFGIMANILFVVELFKDVKPRWNKIMIFVSTFILTTTLAVAIAISIIKITKFKQEQSAELISLLDEHAKDGYVYPLSFDLPSLFPEVIYSDAKYGSRYGHLWMLPGMYQNAKKDENNEVIYNKPTRKSVDEVRIFADILADIAHNPPMLIFIADREYNTQALGNFKFDFIKYMSSNEAFVEIFSNYEELTKIDDLVVYKYKEKQ